MNESTHLPSENSENNNENNAMELPKNIKQKMMFFFLPSDLVFEAPAEDANDEYKYLLSISPMMYWCAAHDFTANETFTGCSKRYLFEYQKIVIEGENMLAEDTEMVWCHNRGEVMSKLLDFINSFAPHKRTTFCPYSAANNADSNMEGIVYDSSNFADFPFAVAHSLVDIKSIFVDGARKIGFETLQKKFWKQLALLNEEEAIIQLEKLNNYLAEYDKMVDNNGIKSKKKANKPRKSAKIAKNS